MAMASWVRFWLFNSITTAINAVRIAQKPLDYISFCLDEGTFRVCSNAESLDMGTKCHVNSPSELKGTQTLRWPQFPHL